VNAVRGVCLLAATLAVGLAAGVFDLYAHTIMPGLAKTDDRTFVAAFQAIDRAIINPWFLGFCFLGGLVFTVAAALSHLGRTGLAWIIAALVLYLVAVIVTFAVHLPLNDALKAAGDPDHISNLPAVREHFDEARWASWNLLRAVTSTLAFALLAWALVLFGRTT
jgi:uncharacterized membrane protein